MAIYRIKQLSFTYPLEKEAALHNISINIHSGDFLVIGGASGCGKSSLLRQLKTVLSPPGSRTGQIEFCGQPLETVEAIRQAVEIGFVMQAPEEQLVTDKVWHELAFGLENLGLPQEEIRLRVAEVSSYFGIESWFYQDVSTLSGGQKQKLNLAAVLAMQPKVLILDEPTSFLDPIAAEDFLELLVRINRDLGVTVILSEQRFDQLLPHATQVILLEKGEILAQGSRQEVGKQLWTQKHPFFEGMPVPIRLWAQLGAEGPCPLTLSTGRQFLDDYIKGYEYPLRGLSPWVSSDKEETALQVEHLFYRHDKAGADLLKNLEFDLKQGQITALVGGNGAGKTTLLYLMAGFYKPYRGKITLFSKEGNMPKVVLMPQELGGLFLQKSLRLDFEDHVERTDSDANTLILEVAQQCGILHLLDRHPSDLSEGELRRAALAKLLLCKGDIFLLDEPTKAMDAVAKIEFANLLQTLKERGKTILLVSHDLEFCASFADYCALLFQGNIAAQGPVKEFFSSASFYTTQAKRMAQNLIPGAVTLEDILFAFGIEGEYFPEVQEKKVESKADAGELCGEKKEEEPSKSRTSIGKKTLLTMALFLCLAVLTVWLGNRYLLDRKYYFIMLLLMVECSIPLLVRFEERRPNPRELVVMAALCALVVVGRLLFAWFPQFKPATAIIVLTGIAFGCESGLFVGMFSALLSSLFFGLGPWTPWQMLGFGCIGVLSGLFGYLPKKLHTRIGICLFGGICASGVYGLVVDTGTALTSLAHISQNELVAVYTLGLPFNLLHGFATVLFLFFAAIPVLKRLERVKISLDRSI